MSTVHLLKSRSDDSDYGRLDPYEEVIDNVNFIPVMNFETVNLDDLVELLKTPTPYQGIIVTSQRAVDVLKVALEKTEYPQHFLSLPAFTVGPATAKRLQLVGFSQVEGAETGNGSALADLMVEKFTNESKKFLFLAGEVHRDVLPQRLGQNGHTIDKLIVYRTTSASNQAALEKIAKDDWVVFFSPSHVSQIVLFIKKSDVPTRIAAIGPTTLKYLTENGVKVDAVAQQPTPESLLEAMNN